VWRLAYSMTVLVVLAHRRVEARDLSRVARVWCWTTAVVTLLGGFLLLARLTSPWVPPSLAMSVPGLGPRLTSTLPANALLPYFAIAVCVLAFLLGEEPNGERRRHWLALWSLLLAAGFFTLSRGTAELWIATAMLGASGDPRLGWVAARRRQIAAVAVLLAAGALVFSVVAVVPTPRGPRIDPSRRSHYLVLHRAAFRFWCAHPWLGVGPGAFGASLADVTTDAERAAAQPQIDLRVERDPHSTWAGWAAQTGTLGVLPLGALFVYIGAALRREREAAPFSFAGTAWIALLAVALNGIHVDLLHLKLVWAYFGLALASRRTEPAGGTPL
jgi:O-antigen ligase